MLGIGGYISPTYEHLYSLDFDGTGDGTSAGDVLDFGTADYSIAFWFKAAEFQNGDDQFLFAKREDANNRVELAIANSSGKIMIVTRGGGTNTGQVVGASDASSLENTWVHVCATVDRSANMVLYVNGTTTLGGTTSIGGSSSQTLNNTGVLNFGCRDISVNKPFTGKMTDIAIWNIALSDAHVLGLYNDGPADLRFPRRLGTVQQYDAEAAAGLVGFWRCNDGSGSTLKDELGNNNATIAGTKAFSTDTPDD
jgi:hypothetical protein